MGTTEKLQDTWAFWKYDLFPFYKGSQIASIGKNGYINPLGFGNGIWFKPVKILNSVEGQVLNNELVRLKMEYDKSKRKLDTTFKKKVGALMWD